MSIPSADHTIYSFITLCLKEQGDIAGRKEITAKQRGAWEKKEKVGCHHRQRHISVTGLRLRSRASYLGVEGEKAWVSPSTPSLNSHLCIPHTSPNCSTWKPCPLWRKQNTISDLSPDDQIHSAVQLPPHHCCHHAFLEVTGRTDKGGGLKRGGGGEGRRREAEGGGALFHHRVMSSSGPGRCFLIFSCCADKWLIVSLDKGTVFPVIGIRGRRKSLRHRVRLSQ